MLSETLHSRSVRRKSVAPSALLPSCSLIAYTEQYVEYDPLITPAEPSNPWVSDDIALWDIEMR